MMKKQSLRLSFHLLWAIAVCSLVNFLCFIPVLIAAEIAPEKDIVVVGEESQEPEWKRMWDNGRAHTRNQQYEKAIPYYLEVLKQKPNIEEVKWELCKVYMEMKQFDGASLLLDSLLEVNGSRIEYLLSAGNISLLTKKENQAVFYFGQVLEQDPGGKFYIEALEGLIDALIGQGKRNLAIPLMEQLYGSGGVSPDLLLNLAQSLTQAGELKKANYYYQELINKYRISPQVLLQAASILEQLEAFDSAAALWGRYLVVADDIYLRQKLADYYLAQNKYQEALPHLIILLDHDVNRAEYLLQVGNIYLLTQGRADRALGYFESYANEFPEGENVSTEIENIRLILANNLLSIVENDGVWMLWTDLAKITPDRVGIYRAMADLLEALGKNKELMEVLQIINIHRPADLQIRLKLSSLYYQTKSYQRCRDTLNEIKTSDNLSADYFQLRMRCEQALKDDQALIASYLAYLDIFPAEHAARAKAIMLGGAIGDLKTVHHLLTGYRKLDNNSSVSDLNILKAGVDALVLNHFYTDAESLVSDILQQKEIDEDLYSLFSGELARIKYLQGMEYAAEQQLRVSLVKSHGNLDIIFDLIGNAIKTKDVKSALIWLSLAENQVTQDKRFKAMTDDLSVLKYYKLKIYQLSGKSELMRKEAHAHLDSLDGTKEYNSYDIEIFKLLIADYYRHKSYQLFKNTISTYSNNLENSGVVHVLFLLVDAPEEGDLRDSWDTVFLQNSVAELFEIYDYLLLLKEAEPASFLLDYLEERLDESVRLEITRAKAYLDQYQYDKAAQRYRALVKGYPDENYFQDQVITIEGYIAESMGDSSLTGSGNGPTVRKTDFSSADYQDYSVEQQLKMARVLWVNDRETDALKLYENLELSLREQLNPLLELIKYAPDYTPISQVSFWNSLLTSEHDIEILDYVMSSSFFASHLNVEISQRTAESYENYRWVKIVAKEGKAKQALNQRKFYQAEKRYQELMEEENIQSENVYTDLATVYNRLGKYAKETELLEKIKEQQIRYPQLQTVVEKNINRRRPQLFFDTLFLKEDGRNGDIDIKRQYWGLGLKIQPALYQEAGFLAGRNVYGNSDDSSILTSNALSALYGLYFGNDAALNAKIGFEDIKETGSSYFLYDVRLSGRLAESIEGYVKMDQSLVSDTINSLSEGVYRRDLQAGVTIDYVPRVFLGIDFTYQDYDDDNDGKKIHLWSSCRIFSDVSSLDITYDYMKLENKIDSEPQLSDLGDLNDIDLGYWSPGNYWKHSLTAKVKRELWPPGKRQSGTSFVAAQYGLGYEEGDNFVQQFEIDILLEISAPFLLKGTFVSEWSDDYDHTEAYATFVYRW
jgi:tetratricopeptide (TPR) repeat protein